MQQLQGLQALREGGSLHAQHVGWTRAGRLAKMPCVWMPEENDFAFFYEA